MSQRRMGMILAGVALALATISTPALAQGAQRGNRGGPGGRGGFGRGGSLVDLAGRDIVQKEIKVTEQQKPRLQSLSQETRSQRDRIMRQLRQTSERAQSRVRNAQPNIPQVPNVPANPGGGFGAGFGGDFGGYGTSPYGDANQGPNPAQLQQMAEMQRQQQQQQQERMIRNEGREQMSQAMQGIQRQSDQALAKILDKEQMTRLREIQLQMEGPFAVINNRELSQRLSITPEQNVRIRDVQTQDRQRRGQTMQQRRAIFESIRNSAQPNAGAQQPNAQTEGRGGWANFDREAFREAMQRPEVQAQLDQLQEREANFRQLAYAGVFKELDRRQSSTYRKMLGEPFDTTAMMRSFFDRGPDDSEQSSDSAQADADDEDADDADDDAPAAKTPNQPAAAEATESTPAAESAPAPTPAPTNRRSSLRERRGLGPAPQR